MWEVSADELLAADDVSLAAWAPLARCDGSPRELLQKCRDRIESAAPPEKQANLLAVAQVMAETQYNDVESLSILGERIMSLVDELMKLPGGLRARAQIEHETERKTTRKNILTLLKARFGSVPKPLARQLSAVEDPKKLDELLRHAATCASLAAFGAGLENP